MKQFREILAAIDLGARAAAVTAGSQRALERSLWLAERFDAHLTLLHSEKADEYWDEETRSFVNGNSDAAGRLERFQQLTRNHVPSSIEVDHVVRSETPSHAIVRHVLGEPPTDLVVAAKRTDRHSDARRLGSVARQLLQTCPCPVWLEEPGASRDPELVLAATDLSAVGDRVVGLSASVADAFGAALHVVHAYSVSLEAQVAGGSQRREHEKEKRDAATGHLEALLADTPAGDTAKIHVGLTSPTRAVLEGVEKLRPGLVVMGTVSRGGIPGLLMGNTAERLVDKIDCALLTIKPGDFVCPIDAD